MLTIVIPTLAPHQVTEVSSPSAHEFADAAEVSTFTRSQLLLAEKALLRELGYSLYHPTSSSFAGAYLSRLVPGLRKAGLMAPRASAVPREIKFVRIEASLVRSTSLGAHLATCWCS